MQALLITQANTRLQYSQGQRFTSRINGERAEISDAAKKHHASQFGHLSEWASNVPVAQITSLRRQLGLSNLANHVNGSCHYVAFIKKPTMAQLSKTPSPFIEIFDGTQQHHPRHTPTFIGRTLPLVDNLCIREINCQITRLLDFPA